MLIFKQISVIDCWCISCEIALLSMSLDFIDDQSTLVQVMAWCRQATSHYLSQCWPRFKSQYGVTRPQWVNQYTACCKLIGMNEMLSFFSGTQARAKWLCNILKHHVSITLVFQFVMFYLRFSGMRIFSQIPGILPVTEYVKFGENVTIIGEVFEFLCHFPSYQVILEMCNLLVQ